MIIMNRMHVLFRDSGNSVKQQLIVCNAITRSKLMYVFVTVSIDTVLNRPYGFQLHGLGNILRIAARYYGRARAHEYVYMDARQ